MDRLLLFHWQQPKKLIPRWDLREWLCRLSTESIIWLSWLAIGPKLRYKPNKEKEDCHYSSQ